MEMQERIADVIVEHTKDGTIIPIKIRLRDEDGATQTYVVKGYKDLTHYGAVVLPSGINTSTHIWQFECKINVFDREKKIRLFYNMNDNIWKVSFVV